MNHGRVVQVGTPADLFEAPLTRFVGYFIGTPAMNFLAAEARDGEVRFDGIIVAGGNAGHVPLGPVTIGIRPEYVEFTNSPGRNVFRRRWWTSSILAASASSTWSRPAGR